MISQTKKAATDNKCTYFAGHFDGHADQAVQRRAHRSQQQV
jgi:Zn-finger protein